MTPLRQRMTEDMQVRNLSPRRQSSHLQQVFLFAGHFHKSPELLGPEDWRRAISQARASATARNSSTLGRSWKEPGPSGRRTVTDNHFDVTRPTV